MPFLPIANNLSSFTVVLFKVIPDPSIHSDPLKYPVQPVNRLFMFFYLFFISI